MKRFLVTTCSLAALTGFAMAQGSTAPSQSAPASKAPEAGQTASPQSGPAGASQSGQANQAGQSNQAGQAGSRSVTPGGALVFYTVQPADMRASKLIGSNVYNRNDENVGEVQDLIIDNGKTIRGIVLSVGGFLGMGERHVTVDPNSVVLTRQNDGSLRVVANTTKDDLKKAPETNLSDLDKRGTTSGSAQTTGQQSNPAK